MILEDFIFLHDLFINICLYHVKLVGYGAVFLLFYVDFLAPAGLSDPFIHKAMLVLSLLFLYNILTN